MTARDRTGAGPAKAKLGSAARPGPPGRPGTRDSLGEVSCPPCAKGPDVSPTPTLNGPKTAALRRLDRKLRRILAGEDTRDNFILADAKDPNMAFGVAAPGPRPGADVSAGRARPHQYKTRRDFLLDIRTLVDADLLDIVLTSASNGQILGPRGGARRRGDPRHPRQ